MVTRTWTADAEYMVWAKLQSGARFNLATSGVANLSLGELPARLEDLELTAAGAYGYAPLVEAIAAHVGAPPDCVVVPGGGTSFANHLALAGLLGAGDEVLIESPAYSLMAGVARYLGATVTEFARRAENGFALEPDEVRKRLSPQTRVIVITNLHNPTSVQAGEEALRAVGEIAVEAGCRVLVDEVYREAVFDATPRSAFHLGPQFVVSSSLTKVYGLSGLRCGWILAEPDLARAFWRLNDLFGVNAPHPVERLAVIALQDLGPIRERARGLLSLNRPLLRVFLESRDDLEVVRTPWGTTAFPRLRRGSVEDLVARLRGAYETSIVPGRFFGAEQHFRIGIGGETSMVREGLLRLGRALDDQHDGTPRLPPT
jgi:aspartate/methionine/tyrosine aminotransferase